METRLMKANTKTSVSRTDLRNKKGPTEVVIVLAKRIHEELPDLQPAKIEQHLEGGEDRE